MQVRLITSQCCWNEVFEIFQTQRRGCKRKRKRLRRITRFIFVPHCLLFGDALSTLGWDILFKSVTISHKSCWGLGSWSIEIHQLVEMTFLIPCRACRVAFSKTRWSQLYSTSRRNDIAEMLNMFSNSPPTTKSMQTCIHAALHSVNQYKHSAVRHVSFNAAMRTICQ